MLDSVDGMRDASGQMYMRNRYYDPATGQFTQTDPIGIAGGLNAYGFAAGDPVSYSDPYGLCPEHLRRGPNRDRCPGGMDTLQYQEAERAIHLLDPEAREGLMDMLVNGDIRLRGKVDNGTPAGSPGGHIEVTAAFFGTTERGFQTTGERAWVLAHEFGHQLQRRQRALLYLAMGSRDVGDYFDATGARFHYWQLDANIYACRHSTRVVRGSREGHCSYLGKPW